MTELLFIQESTKFSQVMVEIKPLSVLVAIAKLDCQPLKPCNKFNSITASEIRIWIFVVDRNILSWRRRLQL